MGKVFMIGDTHLGLGFPNKKDKWFNIHKEYFKDFLIPYLKDNCTANDIIIHMGDLFENQNIVPLDILDYAYKLVDEIAHIAPFHLIVGNHDCYTKDTEINIINTFKNINNVYVYDTTKTLDFRGYKLCLMPYIGSTKKQIELIKQFSDCDYLFCHSDLNGMRSQLTSTTYRKQDKIRINEFKTFKHVYSGHIHLIQENKNFTYVGNIFQMDRSDYGDQKGIYVLDIETNEVSFAENNISPVYKRVEIKTEEDINVLDTLINTKNFIDLYISNNLLINERKLRRKIEYYLSNGNFESINYIDDIKNETDEEIEAIKEAIDNETMDISIDLEHDEYVREYILKQEYKDNFREGLLNEYDNIVETYRGFEK